MKTAVVILNYNTKDYLRQFLPGLIDSCIGGNASVIVADNASTDGSAEMMNEEFPRVRLIQFDQNYGFTGGYNRALKQIQAQYYVLINSDIEVPHGWLQPLVEWMDAHPKCGACGPKLLSYRQRDYFEYAGAAGGLIDNYGYPFCRGRIMQKIEKDEGQYDTPTEDVLWVSGACMMVRASLWKELGGLDERFFAHMEEIDLCWRMQLRGWSVAVVPSSYVYHIGGGTLPGDSPFKLRLNFRNNLLLLENNLPATYVAEGFGPSLARIFARIRIWERLCLDFAAQVMYLTTKKWASYRAVADAHKEYRQLRRKGEIPPKPNLPKGLWDGWIVPKGMSKNEK